MPLLHTADTCSRGIVVLLLKHVGVAASCFVIVAVGGGDGVGGGGGCGLLDCSCCSR